MQSPLLDTHQLEPFIAIGSEDYLDFLGDVIRDVPAYLDDIRSAIRNDTPLELKEHAHKFRGAISFLGCIAMTERLFRLEHHESVTPDQASAIHAELQTLWDHSLSALRNWEKSAFGPSCEAKHPITDTGS